MTRRVPILLSALVLFASPAWAQEDDKPPVAAAPRELIMKKDPAQSPSLWKRLSQGTTHALRRLWEKEQAEAAQGNAKAAEGDVKGALSAYDEAQQKIPEQGDAAAALAFNRSGALLKSEATEAPKALEQALRAQESSDPSLRAKAAYQAALALEQAGKTNEALQGYAQALRLDSEDADSKVNLELLLRQKERQKKRPQQGPQDKDQKQQKDEQQQQQQAKGEKDKDEQEKKGEQQEKDQQAQKEKEQKEQEAQDKKGQEQPQDKAQQDKKDQHEQQPQELGRTEAQRLLDAAKAGEKNLQAWRFGKKPDKDRRRTSAEKDW